MSSVLLFRSIVQIGDTVFSVLHAFRILIAVTVHLAGTGIVTNLCESRRNKFPATPSVVLHNCNQWQNNFAIGNTDIHPRHVEIGQELKIGRFRKWVEHKPHLQICCFTRGRPAV